MHLWPSKPEGMVMCYFPCRNMTESLKRAQQAAAHLSPTSPWGHGDLVIEDALRSSLVLAAPHRQFAGSRFKHCEPEPLDPIGLEA
eukprot:2691487-Rhodomonas_salina.3